MLVRLALVACCTLSALPGASAQDRSFALSGDGVQASEITRAMQEAMPVLERDIVFQTAKGERRGHYRGVLLRDVLDAAGALHDTDRHADLKRTLLVTGRDGYAIAFSVGELLPEFGDTPVIVARGIDGGPLPAEEGLRLVVDGDRRGARAVTNIARVELR